MESADVARGAGGGAGEPAAANGQRLPEWDPDRSLLGQLLAPLPEGSWYEMHLKLSSRVWTLEFELYDDEGPSDVFRWVSEGEGGRWRAGWSW